MLIYRFVYARALPWKTGAWVLVGVLSVQYCNVVEEIGVWAELRID